MISLFASLVELYSFISIENKKEMKNCEEDRRFMLLKEEWERKKTGENEEWILMKENRIEWNMNNDMIEMQSTE